MVQNTTTPGHPTVFSDDLWFLYISNVFGTYMFTVFTVYQWEEARGHRCGDLQIRSTAIQPNTLVNPKL